MRKYFAIITLTSLITLSFCERPTGRQLDSQTAVWGSFSTMVDDPGAMVETNIGLDYSIVKNLELSFDLYKMLGEKAMDAHNQIKMTLWAGSFGFGIGCTPGSANDSDFYALRYLKGDKWISFKTFNDGDFDMWTVGKVWNKDNGLTMGISYHFTTDDFDKGSLQFTWGRAL